MKTVSVIVPVYKGNCYIPNIIHMLEENWKSVNKVENVGIELLFVNDFPAEKLKVDREWIKNISCSVIENKQNQGIHFSRVQGLLHAEGDYIFFLDQDDEISRVYIREQLNALGSYDAIICNGKNFSQLIYKNAIELKKAIDVNEYKKGYNRIVSPGQVLIRRKVIPVEWIDNILKNNGADDYFLWMLLFCKNYKIGIHKKVLYCHLISDENTSKNGTGMNASVFEMIEKMRYLDYLTKEETEEIRKSRAPFADKKEMSIEAYRKEKSYKEMLELWMQLRERGISVDKFLSKKHLRNIAIYGGGIFGRHLYHELKRSNIQVNCFLDQNRNVEIPGIKTIFPGEELGSLDAIIVTPFMEYEQIRKQLSKFYPCNIISLGAVLFNADYELLT